VIRKSGTEPLVRIMGECEDPELLRRVVGAIEAEVAKFA
jgi:phosphoglucosamine mutase